MAQKTFNSKLLDLPPRPKSGFELLYDIRTSGLVIRCPAKGDPVFQVIARDNSGKEKRVTLGRWVPHGAIDCTGTKLDLERIRALAVGVKTNLKAGRDPFWRPGDTKADWQILTLREALDIHISGGRSAGRIGARTEAGYRDAVRLHLGDYQDRPLTELTRAAVRARHLQIGASSGEGAANLAIRVLAATWNRAARQHPELGPSPTLNVDRFHLPPRDYGLRQRDVSKVWEAIEALDELHRDYYTVLMFTGLRRQSASEIRTVDLDLQARSLHVWKPKGGERKAFTLPICNQLHGLFERRAKASNAIGSSWLFPAPSKSGHLTEPRLKGLPPPHAYRHLYSTIAASIVPAYALKALINHSLDRRDVTAGYIHFDEDQLRPHAQAVADHLSSLAGWQPLAKAA